MQVAQVMGQGEVVGQYVYRTSMTTIWEILLQCLSILIVVGILAIGILAMVLMVKAIQALGLYIKKNKIR